MKQFLKSVIRDDEEDNSDTNPDEDYATRIIRRNQAVKKSRSEETAYVKLLHIYGTSNI